jgi:hypothetical protein
MIVNALDIILSSCTVDNSNIITCNASIGATVNKSTRPDLTRAGCAILNVLCAGLRHNTLHHPVQAFSLLVVWSPLSWTEKVLFECHWGDILLLGHVSKQRCSRGVWLRGNFNGWHLINQGFIETHLMKVDNVICNTDVMLVDCSIS